MNEICIISCGKTKIWKKNPASEEYVPARDAYTGGLFRKNRDYAERFFPDHWFILSDKYGLIRPEDLVWNYEISPDEIKNSELFSSMVEFQSCSLDISHTQKITTTSGKIHQNIIAAIFKTSEIFNPVKGLSQGKRMQKLTELLR